MAHRTYLAWIEQKHVISMTLIVNNIYLRDKMVNWLPVKKSFWTNYFQQGNKWILNHIKCFPYINVSLYYHGYWAGESMPMHGIYERLRKTYKFCRTPNKLLHDQILELAHFLNLNMVQVENLKKLYRQWILDC